MKSKINKKSLYSYLIITFSLTWLIVWLSWHWHLRTVAGAFNGQMMLAGAMFVPALATFITRQFITHEGWATAGLKWGRFKDYLNVWLLTPFLFLVIFFLSYILGANPDFSLNIFAGQYGITLPMPGVYIILIVFLVTLFASPWLNSVAGLGEELGWRGHLLPHLLPLGEKKALVISGLIWGLWHVPFVLFLGFGNYNNVFWGAIFFTLMVTLLGVYIGYLRLRSGSTILAGWAHGVFNSQSYGIWLIMFPQFNTLVGGVTGIAGIATIWVLSWYSFRLLDRNVLAQPGS